MKWRQGGTQRWQHNTEWQTGASAALFSVRNYVASSHISFWFIKTVSDHQMYSRKNKGSTRPEVVKWNETILKNYDFDSAYVPILKFLFSKKSTKNYEIFSIDLTLNCLVSIKSAVMIPAIINSVLLKMRQIWIELFVGLTVTLFSEKCLFQLKPIHWVKVLHNDPFFKEWQLMSALARLESFGENDPFSKIKIVKNCLVFTQWMDAYMVSCPTRSKNLWR